jgi:hypothetical protein
MADGGAQVNGSFGEVAAGSRVASHAYKLFSTPPPRSLILTVISPSRALGLGLLLCGSLAATASAQNAPAAGQEPPPKADAGTTIQEKCIDENDAFKMSGKQPVFTIELANKCEQRMSCRVYAYVTTAKGPSQGRGILVLAPKSHGAGAKKTFTMRVTMAGGGNSQSARKCRVF